MAEILEILDKGQILTDIDAVIVEIAKLEEAITKASNKLLTVKVELYGAESLQDVLEGTNAIRKAMVDLGIVQKQNADLVANLNENYGMLGKSFDQALEDYAQLKIQLTVLNGKIAQQNALLLKGGADAEKAAAALEPLIQQQRTLSLAVTNANNIINKSVDERQAKAEAAAEKERIAEINKTNQLKVDGEKRIATINKEQQQKEKAYQQEEAREIKRVQQATTAAQKIVDANSAIYNSVSGLRAKMLELQLAGEGLSQEYLILAERANALTVANQKVNNAVANPAGLAAHIQSTKAETSATETVSELSAEDAALARINARIEQSVAEENALADAKYRELGVTEQLNTANVNSNRIAKSSGEQIQFLQANLAGLQSEQAKHKQGTAVWKQYETAIVNTKGQLQKLGVETANVTPKVEKTGEAFKVMGVNTEQMLIRMTIRMITYQLLFAPIIAGITSMYEWVTKLDEVTQKSLDRLKDYFSDFDTLQNKYKNSGAVTSAKIQIDQENAERLLSQMMDKTNFSFDERFNKYKELQSAYPKIFDNMDKENFKMNEGNERMKLQVKNAHEYIEVLKNLEDQKEKNIEATTLQNTVSEKITEQENKIVAAIKSRIAANSDMDAQDKLFYNRPETMGQLRKMNNKQLLDYSMGLTSETDKTATHGKSDLEDQVRIMNTLKKQFNELTDAEVDAAVKQDELEKKKTHLEGKTKDPKPKKDNAKDLEAELRDEEERYKLELQKYKEMYLAKDNTFEEARIVHQKELYKQEEGAAAKHADFMNTIIAKKEYQFVDSKFARAARLKKVQEEKLKAENDLTGKEKEAALEKAKIEEDLIKKEEEAYQHYKEHADKMLKLDRELEEIKEKGAYNKKYANGISPFLEGLGFDGSFKQKYDELDIQISSKKKQLEDIKKQEDEQLHGTLNNHMVDPKKLYKLAEDKKQTEKDLKQLEFDQDQLILDKKAEAKKKEAELSVELVKTTFDSIKQIKEQEFAWEQRQLDIKMEQVRLHSEQQMQAIDATAGFQIDKDNLKAKVAAQTASEEKDIQAKSNALKLRQARFEKETAEMSIITKTSQAIVSTIAAYAPMVGGIAIAAPIIALEAAIGAAQYAVAASQPLPQFEDGGVTATSHFIAAEGNKPELIIAPSGDVSIASKEGVYTAPIGSTVKNASDTEKLLKYAINGIGINAMSMAALQEQRVKQMTDKRIVEELQDVKAEIIRSAYIGRVINNNVVIKGNDLQRPTRN
jgi:hypothetical protein